MATTITRDCAKSTAKADGLGAYHKDIGNQPLPILDQPTGTFGI
jgi:hypothetical protein